LKVPVLIAHGEADPRVPFKQSKQYADALTAAGKVHEFYPIPDEVHGFSTAAHEQLWFDKLDAFLAKYNPAG
jgi:dipeptidyl aminopeptidase/acylaminoacyl peptidase